MSGLEQKLYQLIISRLDGDNISYPSYQDRILSLVSSGIGGFIVFGGKKEEVRAFINRIQSLTSHPLFIASDIERGVGQQIRGTTSFPSAMAIAAAIDRSRTEDITQLESMLKAVSDEASDVGINMPLIPVLDVNTNPDNPIICTRAFSDDIEKVAWFGSHFIESIESSGLISCAKHFPGHGDTSIDSHIALPVISKSAEVLWEEDMSPFRTAIKSGVSSIMVGHLSVPAIDSSPASLSEKVITNVLRNKLGFKGLIITDALNMDALKGRGNIYAECLNAGVDILLHPADADSAVNELIGTVESGGLSEDTVNTAHERVLRFKSKLQFNNKPVPEYNEHDKTASLIHANSITLVKNTSPVLPLVNMQETSLVFAADENDFDISPLKTHIEQSFPLKECNDSAQRETTIFALFTNVAAWRGSSGIGGEDIRRIKNIIKKSRNSVIIAFGSPYVLNHFEDANVLIAAYDSGIKAQSSVIRCLRGEIDFQGSLPVTLNFS